MKKSPFIPCKQNNTSTYQMEDHNNASNFAKYHKKEKIERKNHADEDLSHQLSPYKNRITVANSYISQLGYKALQQKAVPMRNNGHKRTLQKVLDKLNVMNARLNVDTLPNSNEIDGSFLK